ncbi:hypothetical protein ACHAWC_000285 [Mediolabrus comicus]
MAFDVETAGITTIGWSAFSKMLVGRYDNDGIPQDIKSYLSVNNCPNTAIYKILRSRSHPDLDMEPLFEWKMKFLPVTVSWLQRARSRPSRGNPWGRESNKTCQSRKLSALCTNSSVQCPI